MRTSDNCNLEQTLLEFPANCMNNELVAREEAKGKVFNEENLSLRVDEEILMVRGML